VKNARSVLVFFILFVFTLSSLSVQATKKLEYPKARKVDHVDTYFGTQVPDPYRWLEDDNSEETKVWVEAENKVTFGYFEQIPFRNQMKNRLEQIFNYPRYTAPFRNGNTYFFSKNDGLQNQSVLYMQKGLKGTPEVVIDPNKLSSDGTTRLGPFSVSKDGRYAGYGLSLKGSDWQEYRVMDLQTKQDLPNDVLSWIKVSGISWRGNGFYYSRYPAPAKGKEYAAANENHQVFYHRVGTPQSQDELVYEDAKNPQRFHGVFTDEDERYAFLNISDRGKGKQGNALFYRDDSKGEKEFKPIIAEIGEYSFGLVDVVGGKFLITTNKGAKNRKVVLVDPNNPAESNWKTIIPEKEEPLGGVGTAGGKMFVTYLKDVTTRAYVYDLNGNMENEIQLPGVGSAGGFGGRKDNKFVFYTFSTFNIPPTIYRYDIKTRKTSIFRTPEVKFNPNDYEVKQVFYNSKDGTRVPMFITHKKGLKMDGMNPTLLTGYGGFNISSNPGFSPLVVGWLEQGGVYCLANMRGGSEYGEKWHEAGMRLKKQNVFDDFIAAGEYLIAQKYTSSNRLAIRGGSNGGLLVGAVINQRPDLARVAIPQVGVMDMLRYQKFTIGWNWIAEYGSSEATIEDFKNLYAYSPLHNIKAQNCPATLITTADHDDRVHPAHSFKYAATLQEMNTSDNPILIRIQTNSGHGASSTTKSIEETADIYSFIFYNMGVTPKF
jgi:prolyl oligopeptidase